MAKGGWASAGTSSNKLHKQFSDKIGEDTLSHIEIAFTLGASCHTHDGFLTRNTEVAKSQYLVAFTWDDDSEPKKGGTGDTWKKCQGKKKHISLHTLLNHGDIKRVRSYNNDDVESDGPKRSKVDQGQEQTTTIQ